MGDMIHPTGTCFDDAMSTFSDLIILLPEMREKIWLVHAACPKPDGGMFSHAWVEITISETIGLALFHGIVDGERTEIQVPLHDFRERIRPLKEYRYQDDDVRLHLLVHNKTGPWVQSLEDLCHKPGTERETFVLPQKEADGG